MAPRLNKKKKSSLVATLANVTHTLNSINEGELDNESHGNNVDFERPIGRKAEKAKRKRKEGPSEKKVESLEDARVQRRRVSSLGERKVSIAKVGFGRENKYEKEKASIARIGSRRENNDA